VKTTAPLPNVAQTALSLSLSETLREVVTFTGILHGRSTESAAISALAACLSILIADSCMFYQAAKLPLPEGFS